MKASYILLVALLVGSAVGALFPTVRAEAVASYTVRNHPGPQGATNETVTCGWHQTCVSPYPAGDALDWAANDGDQVKWRSNNFRSDATSIPDNVAIADPGSFNTSECYRIGVVVTDNGSTNRGTVYYTHVKTPKAFYQLLGDSNGTLQTFWAGVVVDHEDELTDDCATDGDHIHQYSSWTKGSGWPTAPNTAFVSDVWDNYMFTKSWSQ